MTELQAAAERLRRLEKDGVYCTYGKAHAPMEIGRDRNDVIAAYLALTDPAPLTESALRGMGFDGPKFDDLDKLSLTNDRLKVTHYFGWNFWILDGSCAGPVIRGIWIRLVDDVKTVEHARRIMSALNISPQKPKQAGGSAGLETN